MMMWSDPMRFLAGISAQDNHEVGLGDLERWPVRFWDVDAGMAAEMQLQLVAVDEGLDTWFFGSPPARTRFGSASAFLLNRDAGGRLGIAPMTNARADSP